MFSLFLFSFHFSSSPSSFSPSSSSISFRVVHKVVCLFVLCGSTSASPPPVILELEATFLGRRKQMRRLIDSRWGDVFICVGLSCLCILLFISLSVTFLSSTRNLIFCLSVLSVYLVYLLSVSLSISSLPSTDIISFTMFLPIIPSVIYSLMMLLSTLPPHPPSFTFWHPQCHEFFHLRL